MAKISARYAVAGSLSQLGVRNVIGMVGSCMIEILNGMYGREDLHFLTVRHEQSAALMVDAFGRMTGKPGVCMATNGPGVTNQITDVANAMMTQISLLVLAGATMLKDMDKDAPQKIGFPKNSMFLKSDKKSHLNSFLRFNCIFGQDGHLRNVG